MENHCNTNEIQKQGFEKLQIVCVSNLHVQLNNQFFVPKYSASSIEQPKYSASRIERTLQYLSIHHNLLHRITTSFARIKLSTAVKHNHW